MNETEIRNRLRDAFGEAGYPPALTARVRTRLGQPSAPGRPRLVALVAALLAVAIVAGLVYVRVNSATRFERPAGPTPPTSQTPANAVLQVPVADLQQAALTTAAGLVTDPNLVSTSNGRTVRLIGAYADTTRTVLILRTLPEADPGRLDVSDDRGTINSAQTGTHGSLGDDIVIIDAGPRSGPDGLAHLVVRIPSFQPFPPDQGSTILGQWSFSFRVKVQRATTLAMRPVPGAGGPWRVTVEAFELTPSVIHLRLLVTGVAPDAAQSAVTVENDKGDTVYPSSSSSSTGDGLHLDYSWPRPAVAATYHLRIKYGSAEYAGSFDVPAPTTAALGGGILPPMPGPSDVPTVSESLTLRGAMDEDVNFGHPWQCRVVTDPTGTSLLIDVYFRSASGPWYSLGLITDLADKPYQGPGTYGSRAYISPLGTVGPTDHDFSGTVQLTVTSATSGLLAGTVTGTLSWDDDKTQRVSLDGGWTCQASAGSP